MEAGWIWGGGSRSISGRFAVTYYRYGPRIRQKGDMKSSAMSYRLDILQDPGSQEKGKEESWAF